MSSVANPAITAKSQRTTHSLRIPDPDLAILATAIINPKTNRTLLSANTRGGLDNAAAKVVYSDFQSLDTTDQIATLTATGLVRATTGNLLHHTYTPNGNVFGTVALGTQTIAIGIAAAGLDVSGDQTDNDGYEVFSNFAGATGKPFVIGYDAAFYFKIQFTVANVSGSDTLLAGFRRAEVNNGTLGSYADYAGMGWTTAAASAALKIQTNLNAGGASTTDTTQTLADATAYTVKILVSDSGVVTFQHDAAVPGVLAAPTATAAFTFDNGDPVIPFFHFLQGSAADTGSVTIQSWEVGYQQ